MKKKLKLKKLTPLSVLKEIDSRVRHRYYIEIDGRTQDKEYFEEILNDIEILLKKAFKDK